jgi:myosin heavy chain 6/7
LEIEVHSLTARIDELEKDAVVENKRTVARLNDQLKCLQAELEEERRRHAETTRNLRKREREMRDASSTVDEERKKASIAQAEVDNLSEKLKMAKRMLSEQVYIVPFP